MILRSEKEEENLKHEKKKKEKKNGENEVTIIRKFDYIDKI